ncbi:transmembrane protein 132D-like [Scleropages formosus]|uniref:transmembrane protein 132D-like n=1 Tax=Scleropages formosus TaxID=113540 RepID=UPI0010FA6681|nr:transmembrane protein 132D-like [Scleropages formosus]
MRGESMPIQHMDTTGVGTCVHEKGDTPPAVTRAAARGRQSSAALSLVRTVIIVIFIPIFRTEETAESQSQAPPHTTTPSPVEPWILPVSYQVLNAEHFLLRPADPELGGVGSPQKKIQPLVLYRSRRPPSVNATYGPLSAVRPVPTSLFRPPAWDVRPFVMSHRILSSEPKVRVLFYLAGGRGPGGRGSSWGAESGSICVTAYGFQETREVRGYCSLWSHSGVCVVELEPEPTWFGPASGQTKGNVAELYYRTRLNARGGCSAEDSGKGGGARKLQATLMQRIGSVLLLQATPTSPSLTQLQLGNAVVIQTSSRPLRKTDVATFYVSTCGSASIDHFTLRATTKRGVSFSRARPSSQQLWDTVLEPGASGTVSVVCQRKAGVTGKRLVTSSCEVLQLDFETEDLSSQVEAQEIRWWLELRGAQGGRHEGILRIYTTQRDYVGLAPLVADTELINTAVLTGKRVTVPVRTVAVERDGSITDVSNSIDCQSTDEDVLKVSERCDYVYVNGKETRGRVKVPVNFTYSYLSAQLHVSVWMPQLPLQIQVSDSELNQIKGWRVPIAAGKRAGWDSKEEEEARQGRGCSLQFQHALVRVVTQLEAESQQPGQSPARFLGGDWLMDVTRLVHYFLKVADPRVARLQQGTVLAGRTVGVTSLQVLSPLSNSLLAEKTVKVLEDRVSIVDMGVQVVSALSLSLQLSPGSNRVIVATATTPEVLNTPKQEAAICFWIRCSDGSLTPLDAYDSSSYVLAVTSLDEDVVSVRKDPLVVMAKAEGQGMLLRAELLIAEGCQKSKRKSLLAVGSGSLAVKFGPEGERGSDKDSDYGSDGQDLQFKPKTTVIGLTNSAGLRLSSSPANRMQSSVGSVSTIAQSAGEDVAGEEATNRGDGDLSRKGTTMTESISTTHGNRRKGTSNLLELGKGPNRGASNTEEDPVHMLRPLSDLEVGMYALLGVFCLAILIFLVNCTSHFLREGRRRPPKQATETPGHKHHWVWLGEQEPSNSPSHKGEPCGHVARPSSAKGEPARVSPPADPARESMGPFQAKPTHVEPPHPSPTSKRKRVHFTTFSTLERQQHLQRGGETDIV